MSEPTPSPEPTPPAGSAPPDPTWAPGAPPSDPTAPPAAAPGPWTPPDATPTPPPASAGPWVPPDPSPVAAPAAAPPYAPSPPPAYGAPGAGWPPPGFPPPYGHPAGVRPRSGNQSTLVGIIVAAATVIVLGICACFGMAGYLSRMAEPYSDGPYAQEPYGEPYYEPYDDEPEVVWPTAEPTPTIKPAQTPSDGPGKVTVVYEVTGRGPVDLEYYDANGDFIQVKQVKLPWRVRMRMHDAERVMVLANHGQEDQISCRITVDGRTVAKDEGEYGVNCSGGTSG